MNQNKSSTKPILLLVALLIINPSCAMSKNKSMGKNQNQISNQKSFKFEDYKNFKKLEMDLRKFYPVGFDANIMMEDMKRSGIRCVGVGEFIFRGRAKIIDNNKVVCELPKQEKGLMYEWDWAIHIYKDINGKIKSIAIEREYFGV